MMRNYKDNDHEAEAMKKPKSIDEIKKDMHIHVIKGNNEGLSGVVTSVRKLYVSFHPYKAGIFTCTKQSTWDYCQIIDPPEEKMFQEIIAENRAKKKASAAIATSTSKETTTTQQRCEALVDVLGDELAKLSVDKREEYLATLQGRVGCSK